MLSIFLFLEEKLQKRYIWCTQINDNGWVISLFQAIIVTEAVFDFVRQGPHELFKRKLYICCFQECMWL